MIQKRKQVQNIQGSKPIWVEWKVWGQASGGIREDSQGGTKIISIGEE